MIIERKYEIIGELIKRDPLSADIIKKELLSRNDEEEAKRILEADYEVFLYLADISSAIPNLDVIREKLKDLDSKYPYDNGLSFNDVSRVEILPSRKGKAAVFAMILDTSEVPKRIVSIIAAENMGTNIELIKPWNIDNVIF